MTAHKREGEQYTYGQYLEEQIPKVIEMYKNDGYDTNQAFMAVGSKESITLDDPPCLRAIDTRIRDNKLKFVVYFRSGEIGVDDGEILALSKGLHLYEYSWELARATARL